MFGLYLCLYSCHISLWTSLCDAQFIHIFKLVVREVNFRELVSLNDTSIFNLDMF